MAREWGSGSIFEVYAFRKSVSLDFSIQGVPKKCDDFNRMPFPQLLPETVVLLTGCS